MSISNVSARTKYANTKDSDAKPMVYHIVSFTNEDGEHKQVEIVAECPMSAIKLVRKAHNH